MEAAIRPVVIVGAGENADIAHEYFTHDSNRDVAAFAVERPFLTNDRHRGLEVVALEDLVDSHPPGQFDTFVALSSTELNRLRRRLFEKVKSMGYSCASYVSSRAFVWHNVSIGENVFVFENNVLQHEVSVGDNAVLWSGNHVGHQTRIGAHCFVTSHVVVSGFCSLGAHTFMGVNASVNDELAIGDDVVVGAGAVVVKDLESRGVYVGNPAKATGKDSFAVFGVTDA